MATTLTKARTTPGVYVTEFNAFGSAIVGVATAEPAFIGYTEQSLDPVSDTPLRAPVKISSMDEFAAYFGGPSMPAYRVTPTLLATPSFTARTTAADGTVISSGFDLTLAAPKTAPDRFCLYRQMQLFFANGGGACWVMSAGSFAKVGAIIEPTALLAGLDAVADEKGPTMLVVPEACQLAQADYASVVAAMVAQASRLQDRVAIIDLPGCLTATDIVAMTAAQKSLWLALEPQIGTLSYAAAYGPALATTVVQPRDVRFPVLSGNDNSVLNAILTTEAVRLFSGVTLATLQSAIAAAFPVTGATTNTSGVSGDASSYPPPATPSAADLAAWQQRLDDLLTTALPVYVEIDQLVADDLNIQPPSGALAGVWAQNDLQSGVWNAPANIALASVAGPLCPITDAEQAAFNVPVNGMAIDILRAFPMRGTVVWGARTLDGNSLDYRYVQVRRTLIYIEQSIKLALQSYVFAPNDSATWATVVASVSSFLTEVWQAGGLMGGKPSDAFNVLCGVPTTMSGVDVLNGHMIVEVSVQVIHPAEFIQLTFTQTMQGV